MSYLKNVRGLVLGLVILMFMQTLVFAFPSKVSFSARLKDDSGNYLNGRHKVGLRIFVDSSSENALWSENHENVDFVSGKFTVDIGSVTAISKSVLDLPNPYLAIAIDDDQARELRLPFTSQFYALKSKYTELADNVDWQNLPDDSIPGSKLITINANQVVGELNNTLAHAHAHKTNGNDPLTLEISQINNLITSLNAKIAILYKGNTGSNDGLTQTIRNESINNSTYAKTLWQADNSNLQGSVGVYKGASAELSMQVGSQSNHPLYLQANSSNLLKLEANSIVAYVPISGNISYATQASSLTDYSVIPIAKTSGTLISTQVPGGIDANKIGDSSISNTEFQYLDGANNNIQSQINNHNHDSKYVQPSTLSAGGSNSNTSGAHGIGVFDEFTNSNGGNVQAVLKDLDLAIIGQSSLASLSDTSIVSLADDDVLAYNSATGKFANQNAAAAGLSASGHLHDAASLTSGIFAIARIPDLSASKITAGTLDVSRIPSLTADRIPNLDATKISSGTLDAARIPNLDASKITAGNIDASRIAGLDASKITSGVLAADRIPQISALSLSAGNIDVARMPASGTWTSSVTIKSGGGIDAGNNGTTLKCKVVQMGPWNMATIIPPLAVPHGLPDITKIRQINVMVRNDAGTKVIDFSTLSSARLPSPVVISGYEALYWDTLPYQGGIDSIDATNINLWAYAPIYGVGWRDGTTWNTAPNRGYITIWYEG